MKTTTINEDGSITIIEEEVISREVVERKLSRLQHRLAITKKQVEAIEVEIKELMEGSVEKVISHES